MAGFHAGAAGGAVFLEVEAVGASGVAGGDVIVDIGGVGGRQPGAVCVPGVLIPVI